MRISTRQALAVAALALGLPAGFTSSASAAPAPPCDTLAFPTPFLRFYGGIFNANTRFIELHIRPARDSKESEWASLEYPFQVTVTSGDGTSKTYDVTNYARQQFPASFTNRTQTAHATATYTEVHGSGATFPALAGTTRCSRTISATYKAPPKPRATRRRGGGSTGGGGRRGHRDDGED